MTAILAILGSKLGLLGMGALIPMVFVLGKKMLPKYFGGLAAKLLGQGFSEMDKIKDPIEKILVQNIAVAVVKWAEYKIPDKGMGHARYDMAAKKLCALLPFLAGRDEAISDIIEAAVVAVDAQMKKTAETPIVQPGILPVDRPPKP